MFTELERRVLLDLIDADNSRDVEMHKRGRTTPEVFAEQDKLYWAIRNKLVTVPLADDPPAGNTAPG